LGGPTWDRVAVNRLSSFQHFLTNVCKSHAAEATNYKKKRNWTISILESSHAKKLAWKTKKIQIFANFQNSLFNSDPLTYNQRVLFL
jgi:hypothetical protein